MDSQEKRNLEKYIQACKRELGAELKRRRELKRVRDRKMSQYDLEEISNVSHATISAIENGTANFYIENLLALTYFLKVTWAEFNKSPIPKEFLNARHEMFHKRLHRVLASGNDEAISGVMYVIEASLAMIDKDPDRER